MVRLKDEFQAHKAARTVVRNLLFVFLPLLLLLRRSAGNSVEEVPFFSKMEVGDVLFDRYTSLLATSAFLQFSRPFSRACKLEREGGGGVDYSL